MSDIENFKRMYNDEDDGGQPSTFQEQPSAIRKNGHIVIEGRPCKVVDISTSHDNYHFVGIDIFTGKKFEMTVPSSGNCDVPNVSRNEYQLLYIEDDSGCQNMPPDYEVRSVITPHDRLSRGVITLHECPYRGVFTAHECLYRGVKFHSVSHWIVSRSALVDNQTADAVNCIMQYSREYEFTCIELWAQLITHQVKLVNTDGSEKDVKLPTDEALLTKLKDAEGEGIDLLVTVVSAMGEEDIISFKEAPK